MENKLIPIPEADRVAPRCPVFGICGGCQLQHLGYEAQLRLKEERLREALAGIDLSRVHVLPIIPAPSPWHYRHRVQVQRTTEGTIGFYTPGSHQLVPIDACPIAHPGINAAIVRLKTPSLQPVRLELIWDEAKQVVSHYMDGSQNRYFTQVNPEQNQQLKQVVLEWLSPAPGMSLLELYAGAGNFTLPLARRGASITAIESSEEAVAAGIKHSRDLPIDWIVSGTRRALRDFQSTRPPRRFDAALLDPPRKGLDDCATLLNNLALPTLLYISCNPTALARDLRTLTQDGPYRLTRLQPLDMFPQTLHLEVVAEMTMA